MRLLLLPLLICLFPLQAAAQTYDCVKPVVIPDRWDDVDGNGVWNPGEPYDPNGTGYLTSLDAGSDIILKAHSGPGASAPGQYYPINLPPLGAPTPHETGEPAFRMYMSGCSPYPVTVGDSLQVEPGNVVGPFLEEVVALIEQDSTASWDPDSKTVLGSQFAVSPRLIVIALFHPAYPPVSGRNYVFTAKFVSLFLESTGPGSQVNAVMVEINPAPTPTIPVSWGRLKATYSGRNR